MSTKTPVLFLSHGAGPSFYIKDSTMKAIDKNSSFANFLRSLMVDEKWIKTRPSSILFVSAHWEESVPTVSYQTKSTSLIYDYYGFPPETYAPHLTYDVSTDLRLADRVYDLLSQANIQVEKKDRGLDHGVFVPWKLVVPDGSIPIVQLSLQNNLDPEYHLKLGEALAPLRNENVLIVGSGQMTHNLGELRQFLFTGSKEVVNLPWAHRFIEWIRSRIEINKNDLIAMKNSRYEMSNIVENCPDLYRCHPRIEHLIPLHVAFGAAFESYQSNENNEDITQVDESCDTNQEGTLNLFGKRIYSEIVYNSMALDCYIFN
jgi:aromatic ring-opening dioxygenase catalytic subunit (LigB family)